MGLLSGSAFRGIVGGIASAYVDRREEARDKISEFQERVRNRVDKVNEKKKDVFDEFEADVTDYNAILQTAGSNLKGNLDSYLMTNPNNLAFLKNLPTADLKRELQNTPISEDVQDFAEKTKADYKIESDNLTQSLQDEVGIFKNQGTLFTKGLYEREAPTVQAITETVDDTRELSRVGKARPEGVLAGQVPYTTKDQINYRTTFEKLYFVPDTNTPSVLVKPDAKTATTQEEKDKAAQLAVIDNLYDGYVNNGYNVDRNSFYSEYLFKQDNPTYESSFDIFEAGDFTTNSKEGVLIKQDFSDYLAEDKPEDAARVISILRASSFESNQELAKELQLELDKYNDAPEEFESEEKEKTSIEQLRDVGPEPSLFGLPLGSDERKKKEKEVEEWRDTYGQLLFKDGTIISEAQKEYMKENPRADKERFVRIRIDQENYKSLNNL
tara:strand:+ start:13 stop:1335 length:1323 start_codon:yes stop_codon:yes gene_type:complete